MHKVSLGTLVSLFALFLCSVVYFLSPIHVSALNILSYKDTLTDSAPGSYSNHTMQFTLNTDIAPGGYLEVTPPDGFTIPATSSFAIRNVEVLVNGTPRTATGTLSAVNDQVIITTGSPGLIRYNLNSTTGFSNGDVIQFKIGNHTSNATVAGTTFSTSTGTTTKTADVGLINSTVTGTHEVMMTTGGGTDPAYAGFLISVIKNVGIDNVDTTETVPPVRFNGAPSGEIGGTTLSVQISLETDELAICKYSTTASTSYASIANTFETTGQLVHTQEITVQNSTSYTFYVRCIDDEDNFNIDDYVISFSVPEEPTGDVNGDGNNDGDGSGTGDSSSGGSGSSGGGSSGSGGSSSGGGGSGGGSGGTSGDDNEDQSGGGTGSDQPYESGDARVIVNGYAFPGSTVTILVDGYASVTDVAGSDGKFSATIDEIARGVYTFGIYAVDTKGVKSTTFSTTFSVQGARTSNLSNINIMPSILVEPDPVDPGQTLTVSGYSIPNATVTLENQKENSSISLKTFTTTSGSGGRWETTIDTDNFSNGTYKIRAKAEQTDGVKTDFSGYTFYGVGQEADNIINADLNRDGSINLTDFSILLFWWGSDGGTSDPPADINGDGRVSLTDFSIMLFNWTG